MKVTFENVGRTKATWTAILKDAEYGTLLREIRKKHVLASRLIDIDNGLITAGFHVVGQYFVEGEQK